MKSFVSILFVVFTIHAYADCAGSGVYFWPADYSLTPNSFIVVTGYAASEDLVLGLGTKYEVYLENKTEKIKLVPLHTEVGTFRLSQIALKPERELTFGSSYTYVVYGEEENTFLDEVYNYSSGKREPVVFHVSKKSETAAPAWIKKPEFFKSEYVSFGCGPGKWLKYTIQIQEENDFLFQVNLTHIKTSKTVTFSVSAEKGMLMLGHGMCSGAFEFVDGDDYEFTADLIDECGNITKWKEVPIKFTAPDASGY
ncbi:MAG: hypothetical protein IPM77_16785 [Crocinitomicaceae bacterium]|nr:hypothetical protein [Crocinitomicaceae bacterium]